MNSCVHVLSLDQGVSCTGTVGMSFVRDDDGDSRQYDSDGNDDVFLLSPHLCPVCVCVSE